MGLRNELEFVNHLTYFSCPSLMLKSMLLHEYLE